MTLLCLITFIWPFLDPNANPNKRQRQPALLGDHPPDYGKRKSWSDHFRGSITHQHCIRTLFFFSFTPMKVDLKGVITAIMTTVMAPLRPTVWGLGWVDVAVAASATALVTDPHPLNTGPTQTHRFLWFMASSLQRLMPTGSSTSSASMAM